MTTQKIVSITLTVVVLAVAGYFFVTRPQTQTTTDNSATSAQQTAAVKSPVMSAEIIGSEPAAGEETANTPEIRNEAAVQTPAVDIEKAMQPRVLGVQNATATIEEFDSLSRSPYAHFHKDTSSNLQESYINTGKVRFYFN